MVFQDQEEQRSHANTGSYVRVRCENGLQQGSATSLRCTEVIETTQEQRLKLTLFVVRVYVYMYAHNFATLNNTRFILLHECVMNLTTHWACDRGDRVTMI